MNISRCIVFFTYIFLVLLYGVPSNYTLVYITSQDPAVAGRQSFSFSLAAFQTISNNTYTRGYSLSVYIVSPSRCKGFILLSAREATVGYRPSPPHHFIHRHLFLRPEQRQQQP